MYEDWRGGQDNSRTRGVHCRGHIDPEIQEQIDYIAAKERARSASNSMSLADAHLEHQMQTVGRAVGTMSSVLQQTLADLRDITGLLHTYGFEALDIARDLDDENSPHFNALTTVAQGIISMISKSNNADSVIQQAKDSLIRDLENVGLSILVPEWEPAPRPTGERRRPKA